MNNLNQLIMKSVTIMINSFIEKNTLALVLSRPDLLDFLLWPPRYLLLRPIFTFLDQILKYFKWTRRIFKLRRDLLIFKKMIKLYKIKWYLWKMKRNNKVYFAYHLMKISSHWEIAKIILLIKIIEKVIKNK